MKVLFKATERYYAPLMATEIEEFVLCYRGDCVCL